MTTPYILPIWLAALFLAGIKGQWQALCMVMVAPYVNTQAGFVAVVFFGYAFWFFATWWAAASKRH